jgi:hypothetical protein
LALVLRRSIVNYHTTVPVARVGGWGRRVFSPFFRLIDGQVLHGMKEDFNGATIVLMACEGLIHHRTAAALVQGSGAHGA